MSTKDSPEESQPIFNAMPTPSKDNLEHEDAWMDGIAFIDFLAHYTGNMSLRQSPQIAPDSAEVNRDLLCQSVSMKPVEPENECIQKNACPKPKRMACPKVRWKSRCPKPKSANNKCAKVRAARKCAKPISIKRCPKQGSAKCCPRRKHAKCCPRRNPPCNLFGTKLEIPMPKSECQAPELHEVTTA